MADPVEAVLAQRRRLGAGSKRRAALGSLALHVGLVAMVLVAPLLARDNEPELEFSGPVVIVPAAALGVRDPQPPRPAPPPEPAPPEPEPEPPAPEPEPEPPPAPEPETRAPALPDPTPSRRTEPSRPTPAPTERTRPPTAGGELERRQGSPTGSSTGLASFGAAVAGLDPNFRYQYYVDQMIAMISSAWVRPPIGGEVSAEVIFVIRRNGSIGAPRVDISSGYSAYDLAALRSVRTAAPFPSLPQGYDKDELRVTLVFH